MQVESYKSTVELEPIRRLVQPRATSREEFRRAFPDALFVLIVTCQGQPFYYPCYSLKEALERFETNYIFLQGVKTGNICLIEARCL